MSTKQSRIVEVSSGRVQGKTFTFENGREASAFLGIPFAKAPIGDLRFKKPVPADKWTEVKQCTQYSSGFPFIALLNQDRVNNSSEDSLFLNVFVPEAQPSEKPLKDLPVLFYIHGGGFVMDSSSLFQDEGICKYLCSKNVIVVTTNYRTGILGFMSLANKEVPGNFGLWDIAAALRWVYDNVAAFGGDSHNITVSGQSAGGAATDLLSLSPHTRDLFHKAIMFGGTSHCEWVNMDQTLSKKVIIEYAKYLGAKLSGTAEEIDHQVYEFYKSCDASKLALGISANPNFKFYPDLAIPLGPCFDGDFFPKPLEELRKEAPPKTVVNGVTEYEGLLFTVARAFSPHLSLKQFVEAMVYNMRPDLKSECIQSSVDKVIGALDAESDEYSRRCVQIISDVVINCGSLAFSDIRTETGSTVYNFEFSYYRKGTLGAVENFLLFEASTHCMELPYLFGSSIVGSFKMQKEDEEIVDRFVTYLTTFMKTGNPNNTKFLEKWEQHRPENGDTFFSFGQNEFGNKKGFGGGDRSRFWQKLFRSTPRRCHI